MRVSENVDEALAEANRPPELKVPPRQFRLQMTSIDNDNAEEEGEVDDRPAVGPKRPLTYDLVTMLRPKQSDVSSNGDGALTYEYDDLPILESSRTSCCTPGKAVVLAMSTTNDRLSDDDCVPKGELHVWVYEACRLLAPWSTTDDDSSDKYGIRVRCDLLGAVQISPRNLNEDMRNPVWRHADNGLRDGTGGHFAWVVNEPLEASGDRLSTAAQISECTLDINLVCGERVVGSASMPLEDLLLLSKVDALEGDGSDGDRAGNFYLSPHWLPLAGSNAGLLQVSLEFVPASQETRQRDVMKGINCTETVNFGLGFLEDDNSDDANQSFIEVADLVTERAQQSSVHYSRDLMEGRQAVPWRDERRDKPKEHVKDNENSRSKVVVSRSGGVTMYVPTQKERPPQASESVKRPARKGKSPTSKSVPSSCGKGEKLMDKQLRDLYCFGIAEKPPISPIAKDSEGIMRTTSMASMYSGKASTCASDALAYNELIQDMENAMNSKGDAAPFTSNQVDGEVKDHAQMEATENKSGSTPKLKLKNRRMGKPLRSLSKPLGRIHSLWHVTRARASDRSSNESNRSSPPRERSGVRKIKVCLSSDSADPVTLFLRNRTPSPLQQESAVKFDPQNQPGQVPFERSTYHEEALKMANRPKRERRAAVDGPGRLSLPISTSSLQHRREMLSQQQPSRSRRQQFEDEFGLHPVLLESVDPPLLRRGRSDSTYALSDLYSPKIGDASVATSARKQSGVASSVTGPAPQGTNQGTAARRHSGSNVVYIDGAPSCIGKFINVGNVPGVVRFIGTTHFATGTWVGIELCEQMGKNSGTIDGQTYFSCAPNHGIFIRASRLGLSLKL